MRDLLVPLLLAPLVGLVELLFWLADPERRIVRSAVLAGLAVGKVVAGTAW